MKNYKVYYNEPGVTELVMSLNTIHAAIATAKNPGPLFTNIISNNSNCDSWMTVVDEKGNEIYRTLTEAEKVELSSLQEQMNNKRRKHFIYQGRKISRLNAQQTISDLTY